MQVDLSNKLVCANVRGIDSLLSLCCVVNSRLEGNVILHFSNVYILVSVSPYLNPERLLNLVHLWLVFVLQISSRP